MSSTGRGTQRADHDFYATPAWCVRAIALRLGDYDGQRVIDTSAGRGAILSALRGFGSPHLTAVEIDAGRCAVLADKFKSETIIHADFLSLPIPEGPAFDLAVINPPFSAAQEHIERSIAWLKPRGRCAALLRLAFCAGAKRAPFRARYPFDLYPLASRPNFTAEALTWMTETDLWAARQPTRSGGLESVDEVRARLRGTDSADYAWFIFYPPGSSACGGRFEVLEVEVLEGKA